MTPDESTITWLSSDLDTEKISINSYDLADEQTLSFQIYAEFQGHFSFTSAPNTLQYETLYSSSINVTVEMVNPCREISSSDIIGSYYLSSG